MNYKIKKVICIIAAIAIAASMSACNNSPTENTYKEESSSVISSDIKSESDQAISSTNVSSEAVSTESKSDDKNSQKQDKASSSNNSGNSSSSKTTSSKAPASSSDPQTSSAVSSELQTVKITFPEGSTVARIFDMLDEKGVAKKADLFSAMETMDFSAYPLIQAITPKSSERCFLLEGYLYTSTYDFYIGESPENVLKRFLDQSEKRIKSDYRNRAQELGYTIDDMIILASILEKEVHKQSELAVVSSVFHNRLNAGQKLQSDATIKYVEGAIKPYITGDINRYNSFYNTYKCKALPAGAICNPSMKALEAALNPSQTDYLYFATDSAGNYYYSATYEEHKVVVDTLK